VTATGHVGRLLLADHPGDDASRVAVWSLALGTGARIELTDVVSASPLARAWMTGFLAGRGPRTGGRGAADPGGLA